MYTLVHRVCENEFVRYYQFSNSETEEANQTKRACFIGKQRDIHEDHIVNISGFYQL